MNFHNTCDLIHQSSDGIGPNCSSVHLAAYSCLLPCTGSRACMATKWVRSACWSAGEWIQQIDEAHVAGGRLGMDHLFQQQLRKKDWVWHETVLIFVPSLFTLLSINTAESLFYHKITKSSKHYCGDLFYS